MADQSNQNQAQKRSFSEAFLETNTSSGEVRIPCTKSMNLAEIVAHFEEFGEIDGIELTIRFKNEGDARSVLHNRHHKVGNYILTVKQPVALEEQQTAKKAKLAHAHSSPMNILNFEDEFLLENVFKYMDVQDLCNISETCKKFKKLSEDAFSKYEKGHYTLDMDKMSYADSKMLQNFGSLIRVLRVVWDRCLSELEVKVISKAVIDNCKGVQELHLCDDSYDIFGVVYPAITELYRQLKPTLLRFNYSKRKTLDTFDRLLEANPSLKHFILKNHSRGYINHTSQWVSIAERLPNIETLCCDFSKNNGHFSGTSVKDLCKLSSLRILHLRCHRIPIYSLVHGLFENSVPIECLILEHCGPCLEDENRIVDVIAKLKKIKKLKLENLWLSDEHLKRLAKSLPNLEEFGLRRSDDITIDGIKEMLQFAGKLVRMSLTINPFSSIKSRGISNSDQLLKMVQPWLKECQLTTDFLPYVEDPLVKDEDQSDESQSDD